ncbi:MAG: potassium-transporting ATPase subunit KdpA [Desulfobacula sp.]|jgi:K+-transporting ATPase ATPase A chain
MNKHDLLQVILFFVVLFGSAPILGRYMAAVFKEINPFRFFEPVESFLYRVSGVDAKAEMHWTRYLGALLLLNLWGFLIVFLLQIFQAYLPFNPQHLTGVEPFLAFNTAVSFMTNTNWQAYSGESTLSYLVQMLGLTVQNFLSAATGMGVLLALSRGIIRKNSGTIGNFWSDIVKTTLYILLPLSFIMAVFLVSQGVVQTFSAYQNVQTLAGTEQIIPLGPAASQIAIKQLGTNGGGFFGVNSAHPFENPTPFSNFFEMLAILLIPTAQVFAFGRLIHNRKHAFALFGVMAFLLIAGFGVAWYSESASAHFAGVAQLLEGKEVRFGVMNSNLWETLTTAASNGSVNAMHDSMSPLAILVGMFNIMSGEVIFGGVGAGLYGMFLFVMLTIFLVGLMVGRTPEYLGKKIDAKEMRWTMAGILIPNLTILIGAALAICIPSAAASILNAGPHGLSEIAYAFSSAAGNNGSALAGLNVNTPFYNSALSICMLLGRFGIIVPVLAIAGCLARKSTIAESDGTFHADNIMFAAILLISILIVGALTFVPMLLLGPVTEHLMMISGYLF